MPKKRKMQGDGFGDFLKKAWGFTKKHKVLSTIAGEIPHPVGKIASFGLKALGLGRKRQQCGGGGALYGKLYLV